MGNPSEYVPGSRAIRIPLHGYIDSNYNSTSNQRRTNTDRHNKFGRPDSNDFSLSDSSPQSSPASSSGSASSSRNRGVLLKTQNTVASPSDLNTSSQSPDFNNMRPPATPASTQQRKDKQRADLSPPSDLPSRPLLFSSPSHSSPLGPNMLSSSAYKSINLNSHLSGGDPDEPARLITYTKHSQGFTWNDELFLPSYLVGRRYGGGRGGHNRRRWGYGGASDDIDDEMDGVGDFDEEVDRCPVADIFVTDEEAQAMLP